MKVENKNGVTRISDFEIDKGLQNLKRGISLETFFNHEALRFEYGAEAYFDMLVREIDDRDQDGYFDEDWEYFELMYGIGSSEMRNIILELQKKAKQTTPPPANKQLQTKLNDTQRGKLYDLLIKNKFIPTTTDKKGFIWAFGGEQPQPKDWQPIEWIDKSTKRKEPNIQTLYELLYLLKVDKDTSANNPNNLYRRMEFCFSDLTNIAAKNPTTITQDTERKKLLKSIIEEVKKAEAQK